VNRVRFDLDCDTSNLRIGCPDDGDVISYQGRLVSDCGVQFTAISFVPNQIIFTTDRPLVIPANNESFCALAFDLRIDSASHDATPDLIEEVAGYDPSTGDAVCDNTPPLTTSRTNTGQICIGPDCETANTPAIP
jgi:hypothetical protein